MDSHDPGSRNAGRWLHARRIAMAAALLGHGIAPAHASLLSGEAVDTAADILAIAVLVIVPVVGITVFWLVHILPEKMAEKRGHPQAEAIKVLCLLSLVFGGLLWPLAWLWAFSRPVLYKLAYGRDREDAHAPAEAAVAQEDAPAAPADPAAEIVALRARVAALEAREPPVEGA
jgi:CBS domain containing-hemolysin-like protein